MQSTRHDGQDTAAARKAMKDWVFHVLAKQGGTTQHTKSAESLKYL